MSRPSSATDVENRAFRLPLRKFAMTVPWLVLLVTEFSDLR